MLQRDLHNRRAVDFQVELELSQMPPGGAEQELAALREVQVRLASFEGQERVETGQHYETSRCKTCAASLPRLLCSRGHKLCDPVVMHTLEFVRV